MCVVFVCLCVCVCVCVEHALSSGMVLQGKASLKGTVCVWMAQVLALDLVMGVACLFAPSVCAGTSVLYCVVSL